MLCLKLIILFSCLINNVQSADILLLSSVSSVSHSRWYAKLALLLANHGHQVTVLDTTKINVLEHPNITYRIMEGGYEWLEEMEEDVKNNPNALDEIVESNTVLDNLIVLADPTSLGCEKLMKSQGTRQFLDEFKRKTFDLIIGDGFCECFYGLVSVFGNPPLVPTCPYIEIVSSDYVGIFDNPSYVPFHMSNFHPKMSFCERLINTVCHLMSYFIIYYYHLPQNDIVIREVLGPSARKLDDILRNNVPLIMTGNNYVIQGAKPLPPNYIPVGGFHVDPPQPLPQDIEIFLNEAKEGAILFSMGSNFKSILMSNEKREMFLSVFRNIPQRVIWKLELENSENILSNVMIKKWLPQSDILAHPKVKAFISHGGLLGTQEAVYRGVPVLGIPLMADQINNLMRLEAANVGIRLYYKELSREYIADKISKIIHDPSYMQNMKELSAAFKDSPQTPQERALFWIEYVLRNSNKNKNYLRPASLDLAWYQLLLLDVIAFVLLCLIVIYFIVKFSIQCILKVLRKVYTKNNKRKTL